MIKILTFFVEHYVSTDIFTHLNPLQYFIHISLKCQNKKSLTLDQIITYTMDMIFIQSDLTQEEITCGL